MRTSYAFNDVLYGLYKGVSDEKAALMLSGLTYHEANLIRGRLMKNGKYMSTFNLMWIHSRNIRILAGENSLGVTVARPSFCNSASSKKTYEYCRHILRTNHNRLVRLLNRITIFQDEPEWSFPKGRVSKTNLEERRINTAIREFYEETHCEVSESFILDNLLKNINGKYETLEESISVDSRTFQISYYVLLDPRPLNLSACNLAMRLTDNPEIDSIFWRRPEAFINKWSMYDNEEKQKINTLRQLFMLHF